MTTNAKAARKAVQERWEIQRYCDAAWPRYRRAALRLTALSRAIKSAGWSFDG